MSQPLPAMIQKVVAAFFAATRDMDPEAWIATFAEDVVSQDPVGGVPMHGTQGLREFFHMIAELFERMGLTEDSVFVAGNGAAVKWTGRGTGKNGADITFEGIHVFDVNDQGKIQKVWGYWDPTRIMAALMS